MADGELPVCVPPDANLRRPRIAVPPQACDSHAHVFGPAERYKLSPKRGYDPAPATPEDYRRLLDSLGIERGVVTQPSVYGTDNSALLDALAGDPERLRGVASVGAEVTEAELERLDRAGVRGVRVNLVDPGGNPFDSFAGVERLASRIRPLGWHLELLVHVHEFEDLPRRLGGLGVDVVVAHLGYTSPSVGVDHPGFRDFLGFLAEGRCWVKLSGPYRISAEERSPYADTAAFAQSLVATRPDRLVWGSDWPHVWLKVPMPNDAALLDLLGEWVPDEGVRRRILVDNPARLYRF